MTAPPVSTTVLTVGHRAECYASGLSDETIRLAKLYSITKAGAAELLGYGVGSAGVVFPYVTTNGLPFARVKLDAAGPDGKRYRSPLGRGNHFYIPPAPLFEPALRANVTVPLYITEGEKKVLAGCQAGLPVLGLPGVWAWRMKSADGATSRPIPDLDQIAWAGRTVSLVFDSDVRQNPKVAAAEAALAAELARRGATVVGLRLPVDPGSAKVGLDDYLLHHSVETFLSLPPVPLAGPSALEGYLETMPRFLDEEDPPMSFLLPELLPLGVILLLHGEPRARKSLAAFELALAAATGTAPFGLARFRPAGAVPVLYVQEEDSRVLTRQRVRRLVEERCGPAGPPSTFFVSVRRGVNLDDAAWVARLIADMQARDVQLLVLDAARRLSRKTDEGPAKVGELMAVLRHLIAATGVSIIIVHHDVKPPRDGQDQRRRSQRASGGDWFAACECPVHVERTGEWESLCFPEDYKFGTDPAPFTFETVLDGAHICRLVGRDTDPTTAELAGKKGQLLAWLRANGPAAKTAMKRAGFGWERLEVLLDLLQRERKVDAGPGRTANSLRYFAVGASVSGAQDGSPGGRSDAS